MTLWRIIHIACSFISCCRGRVLSFGRIEKKKHSKQHRHCSPKRKFRSARYSTLHRICFFVSSLPVGNCWSLLKSKDEDLSQELGPHVVHEHFSVFPFTAFWVIASIHWVHIRAHVAGMTLGP